MEQINSLASQLLSLAHNAAMDDHVRIAAQLLGVLTAALATSIAAWKVACFSWRSGKFVTVKTYHLLKPLPPVPAPLTAEQELERAIDARAQSLINEISARLSNPQGVWNETTLILASGGLAAKLHREHGKLTLITLLYGERDLLLGLRDTDKSKIHELVLNAIEMANKRVKFNALCTSLEDVRTQSCIGMIGPVNCYNPSVPIMAQAQACNYEGTSYLEPNNNCQPVYASAEEQHRAEINRARAELRSQKKGA